MIDISPKHSTLRYAKAEGILNTSPGVIETVRNNQVPKGDIFQVARAAGIQAAKHTSDWIVFCHTLPMDWVELTFDIGQNSIRVTAEARTIWKTGLEMEVMTAVSAALLNMYDMLKPLDEEAEFGMVKLVEKRGGKSDYAEIFEKKPSAALLFASDAVYKGDKKDRTTAVVREFLENRQIEIASSSVISEEPEFIEKELIRLADRGNHHFIFTMGSTGLRSEDVMPEVTGKVVETVVPGLAEGMREHGRERTPYAMFSRGICGIRNQTLIVNLPGSSRGAEESLQALFPGLEHILLSMGRMAPQDIAPRDITPQDTDPADKE